MVLIKNILGKFETYVYTKLTLILHFRLFMEFRWFKKEVIYLRDKYKHDGGKVYWNRISLSVLTQSKDKVKNLLKLI